jgi:tRNA dimethylallyltransferase
VKAHKPEPPVILITGPTASGKSALALAVAERVGGVIINADSMQVYRDLRVLTARPSAEEEQRRPHRLYGHVDAAEPYSVARWLDEARREIEDARLRGLRPIVVGGTGLYLTALVEGLSPMPAIPVEIRARWREIARNSEAAALHARLTERDPVMASRLNASDRQRVTRALEVLEATGRSLAEWQAVPGRPLLPPSEVLGIVVMPPREVLWERSDARFMAMIEAGALDEAAALAARGLSSELQAMRAIGLPPLLAHVRGGLSLPAAIVAGQGDTRRYIKRQSTWIKGHFPSWNMLSETDNCKMTRSVMRLIDRWP